MWMAHWQNSLPRVRTRWLVIIKRQYIPTLLEHSAPASQNHIRGTIWRKTQDSFYAITLLWLSFTLLFFDSTILWFYYSLTRLFFDSTSLWLYYSLALLVFFHSTILWLYYSFTTMLTLYHSNPSNNWQKLGSLPGWAKKKWCNLGL